MLFRRIGIISASQETRFSLKGSSRFRYAAIPKQVRDDKGRENNFKSGRHAELVSASLKPHSLAPTLRPGRLVLDSFL